MKWYKISALMKRDLTIVRRAKYRVIEYFYFPLSSIIIWGLFALYSKEFSLEAGLIVLVVNIFWNFSLLSQSNTNLSINEDVWSGSIKQILVSGVSEAEYIVSRIISSGFMSAVILGIMLLMGFYLFSMGAIAWDAGIFSLLVVSTFIASVALAILVAALLVYLGREYTFLAWTILQVFIMFSAPFYPPEIFPTPIKELSVAMPFTSTFLALRTVIQTGTVSSLIVIQSLAISTIYLLACTPFYFYSFRRARRKGILVKMG